VRLLVALAVVVTLAAGGASLGACGGRGGQLRGSVYSDREARYRIGTLSGDWRRLRVEDQNDLAWRSERLSSIVQVNATCDPGSDVPLTALTNHLLMGFTDRETREQAIVPMDGREALRTHVVARLDGVPRELLFYVLKKDDCVYDLTLLTPVGAPFERALVEFEPFVQGFATYAGTGSE